MCPDVLEVAPWLLQKPCLPEAPQVTRNAKIGVIFSVDPMMWWYKCRMIMSHVSCWVKNGRPKKILEIYKLRGPTSSNMCQKLVPKFCAWAFTPRKNNNWQSWPSLCTRNVPQNHGWIFHCHIVFLEDTVLELKWLHTTKNADTGCVSAVFRVTFQRLLA